VLLHKTMRFLMLHTCFLHSIDPVLDKTDSHFWNTSYKCRIQNAKLFSVFHRIYTVVRDVK
jgi:hypothetical protein